MPLFTVGATEPGDRHDFRLDRDVHRPGFGVSGERPVRARESKVRLADKPTGTRDSAGLDKHIALLPPFDNHYRFSVIWSKSIIRHCEVFYCMFSTIIRLLEWPSICGNSIHLPSGETGIAPIHHGADFSSEKIGRIFWVLGSYNSIVVLPFSWDMK
jgi:hypothetical protein